MRTALTEGLADSEIDTLVNASRQDYGQFDDLLRKAFHHEPVASSRKTDNELIRIDRPRLALLLAGTPGQFTRLVPNVENGLASRVLLYTCRSEAIWQDVSLEGEEENFDSHLSALSGQLLEVALKLRDRPLKVRLTPAQWQELNSRFSALLKETDLFGSEYFLGVVKRHGLMAFRLCMIFTALDAASLDYGVRTVLQYASFPDGDGYNRSLPGTQSSVDDATGGTAGCQGIVLPRPLPSGIRAVARSVYPVGRL